MKRKPILILMTKIPVAGKSKTRLMPNVSADTAAAIALEMIVDTVEKAAVGWAGPIGLLVDSDRRHPRLSELAARFDLTIGTQSEGDLGAKMEHAISEALSRYSAAAVMGCDIPEITPAILRLAYDRLLAGCNVMGPSADGGFYFAGFTDCAPGMFENIEWSAPSTLAAALAQLQACKMSVDVMLPCLKDIDRWRDFVELANNQSRFAEFLP